jgi:HK97 family phage major capsid protein
VSGVLVRDRLKTLRDDRRAQKDLRKKVEKEPESGLTKIVLQRIEEQLEALDAEEQQMLRELSSNGSYDGDGYASVGTPYTIDPELHTALRQAANSKGQFGTINFGEIQSAEEFRASLGGIDLGGSVRYQAATGVSEAPGPLSRKGPSYGIVQQLRRPTRLLDLVPTAVLTSGNSFDYVQETGNLDEAQEQVEGVTKAATDVTYADATAWIETVATWTKMKRQQLEDTEGLQAALSGRLQYMVQRRIEKQMLSGTGHANGQIQGILTMTGIGSIAYSATELEADQTLEGIVAVLLSDATPNAVCLHPRDWANMLKEKASTSGVYHSMGPFLATAEQLWGTVAIPTAAVQAGSALVGDWNHVTLFIREGVTARTSDSDQDDWIKNRVTTLVEGRVGVAVWQPTAFCLVDFTA